GAETQDIRSQSAYRQQMAGLEQVKMQMEQYKMQAAQEHAAKLQKMGDDFNNDLMGATDDNSRADVTLRHAGRFASVGENLVADGLIKRSEQFAQSWNASATKQAISDVIKQYDPARLATDLKYRAKAGMELFKISPN